jgi:hypothetical protein
VPPYLSSPAATTSSGLFTPALYSMRARKPCEWLVRHKQQQQQVMLQQHACHMLLWDLHPCPVQHARPEALRVGGTAAATTSIRYMTTMTQQRRAATDLGMEDSGSRHCHSMVQMYLGMQKGMCCRLDIAAHTDLDVLYGCKGPCLSPHSKHLNHSTQMTFKVLAFVTPTPPT